MKTKSPSENKYFKPGTAEDNETAPKNDLQVAVEAGDHEAIKDLVGRRRMHTYDAEMAKLGVTRDDKQYLMAFEWALIWLYEHRPYYAYCFDEIVRKVSHDIDTLCVTVKGGRVELWANPDFMSIHNLRHNVGFLQHEIGHVTQGHLLVAKKHGPKFFQDPINNLAMDLAVDSLIQSPGDQPRWVLLPSKLRIPDPNKPEDRWQNFKERQTWEYYRDLLSEMRDKNPQQYQQQVVQVVIQRPQGDKGQGGERQHSDQGEGEGEGSGGKGEGEGRGGKGEGDGEGGLKMPGERDPLTMDDHRAWLAEGSDSAEIADEVIRYTVKSSYKKAENNHRCQLHGYMPGEMIQQIEELIKEKAVPFEKLLRAFVGSQLKTGRKPTMTKLSRRRKCPPGTTFQRQLRILFLRDTSGSMHDEEMLLAYSEVHHLAQSSNVKLFFQDFDHGLQGPTLELDQYDVSGAREVKGRGGTDFSMVMKYIDEFQPDVALIFTDLYAPYPPAPRTPLGWVVTHGGNMSLPEYGMVIKLPSVEEIRRGYKANIERWQ